MFTRISTYTLIFSSAYSMHFLSGQMKIKSEKKRLECQFAFWLKRRRLPFQAHHNKCICAKKLKAMQSSHIKESRFASDWEMAKRSFLRYRITLRTTSPSQTLTLIKCCTFTYGIMSFYSSESAAMNKILISSFSVRVSGELSSCASPVDIMILFEVQLYESELARVSMMINCICDANKKERHN